MSKPPTIHTVESLLAQTVEDGDCLLWQGYYDKHSSRPEVCVTHPISPVRSMWSVRRLIQWLQGCTVTRQHAKKGSQGQYVYTTTCGHPRCVAPEHIERRTKSHHAAVLAKAITPGERLRRTVAITRTSQQRPEALTPEQRHDAMTSTDSLGKAAARIGCSKSTVRRLRTLDTNAANPFAQLLRHTGTLPSPRRGAGHRSQPGHPSNHTHHHASAP